MIFNIFGRLIDNGFSISKAIKSEVSLRKSVKKYPQSVEVYLTKLGDNYGLIIREFEVYSEKGLKISLFKNNKSVELLCFEKNIGDKTPNKFTVKEKLLDKNMVAKQIGEAEIISINNINYDIDSGKMRMFTNKDDLLNELRGDVVTKLLSEFEIDQEEVNKRWDDVLLKIN